MTAFSCQSLRCVPGSFPPVSFPFEFLAPQIQLGKLDENAREVASVHLVPPLHGPPVVPAPGTQPETPDSPLSFTPGSFPGDRLGKCISCAAV